MVFPVVHLGAAQAVLIVSAAATIGVVVPPASYMLILWTLVAWWDIRNLKKNKPVGQLKPA